MDESACRTSTPRHLDNQHSQFTQTHRHTRAHTDTLRSLQNVQSNRMGGHSTCRSRQVCSWHLQQRCLSRGSTSTKKHVHSCKKEQNIWKSKALCCVLLWARQNSQKPRVLLPGDVLSFPWPRARPLLRFPRSSLTRSCSRAQRHHSV